MFSFSCFQFNCFNLMYQSHRLFLSENLQIIIKKNFNLNLPDRAGLNNGVIQHQRKII